MQRPPPHRVHHRLGRRAAQARVRSVSPRCTLRSNPRVLGPAKPRFQTYLEVDLTALLNSLTPAGGQLALGPGGTELNDFLRFYLLFSPVGSASNLPFGSGWRSIFACISVGFSRFHK
jgi:hypothetical protein